MTSPAFESSVDMFPAQAEGSHTSHNDGVLQTPTHEQTKKFLRPTQQQSETASEQQPPQKKRLSLGGARKKDKKQPVKKLSFPAQEHHHQQHQQQQQQQQQQPQPQLDVNKMGTSINDELAFSLSDSMMANIEDIPATITT